MNKYKKNDGKQGGKLNNFIIIAGLFLSDEVFKARLETTGTVTDPEAFIDMETTTMRMIAKIDDVIHDGV